MQFGYTFVCVIKIRYETLKNEAMSHKIIIPNKTNLAKASKYYSK